LHSKRARFSPSLATADSGGEIRTAALREATELFVRAGHVQAHGSGDDVIYVVAPEARMSLDLAKNVIVHFFAPRAIIATAILASPGPILPVGAVRERVLSLSRLFKYEFTFRADAPFEQIFDEEIAAMEADREIVRIAPKPGEGGVGVAPQGDDGLDQLALYANILANFIEGYRLAARSLTALLRGPLSSKEVVRRAIAIGQRMFLAGDLSRREAVSSPMIENAYASFIDQGYVARSGGKLTLTESYATADAVATIEARIAAMRTSTRPQTP
jgi:glycerol-3-phosphate O-acyltransferase